MRARRHCLSRKTLSLSYHTAGPTRGRLGDRKSRFVACSVAVWTSLDPAQLIGVRATGIRLQLYVQVTILMSCWTGSDSRSRRSAEREVSPVMAAQRSRCIAARRRSIDGNAGVFDISQCTKKRGTLFVIDDRTLWRCVDGES